MVVALIKRVAKIHPTVKARINSLGVMFSKGQLATVRDSGISNTIVSAKAPRNEPQERRCCQDCGIRASSREKKLKIPTIG